MEVPSRLALSNAVLRAYHHVMDTPRILSDPLAMPITGMTQTMLDALASPDAGERKLRLFVAARTRYAEDTIDEAVASGVRQVVLLGPGLETYMYRHPDPAVRMLEVDRPEVQTWKRERLIAAEIAIPASVRLLPLDLATQPLDEVLTPNVFDRAEPSVFVWLGRTMYRPETAVLALIRFVAELDAPTQMVFDYVRRPQPSSPEAQVFQYAQMRLVDCLGEPWVTFFDPNKLAEELQGFGFEKIDDLPAVDLLARYDDTSGPADALVAHHLIHART